MFWHIHYTRLFPTLQGCVVERMTGKAYAMEDFQEVVASIIMSSMQMNKRTHALQLMMHMLDNDLDVSPH